jgi:hypothetical protein
VVARASPSTADSGTGARARLFIAVCLFTGCQFDLSLPCSAEPPRATETPPPRRQRRGDLD